MYVLTVAWRLLHTRPMSYVAALIITLVVVLYLVIISVLEGFKTHWMDSLQSVQAHITARIGNQADGIGSPRRWAERLERIEGVRGVTAGLEIPVLVQFDQARSVGTLRGIDLEKELRCGRLGELLTPPDLRAFGEHPLDDRPEGGKLQGCLVGEYWRRQYGLQIGGTLVFCFYVSAEDGYGEDRVRALQFQIVGFFQAKAAALEQAAYVDRAFLSRQLGLPGRAKTLNLWVTGDPDRPDLDAIREEARRALREVLAGEAAERPEYRRYYEACQAQLRVETWREKESNYYYAASRENLIMRFIMAIFLFFVAIIILLILSRLVAEKTRDIGALRALGATPEGIRICFLGQGLAISLSGLLLGLPLALLLIRNLNWLAKQVLEGWCGLVLFPPESFLIDHIPTRLLPFDLALIVALTLLSGLLGAFLPAWRASRLDPVECLRHE